MTTPPPPQRPSWVVNVAGFGLAGLLLWSFFRRTDWGAVGTAVSGLDPAEIGLAIAGMVGSLVVRARRWQVLLRGVDPGIGFGLAWRGLNVGVAMSALLPGRLGDLMQPWIVAKDRDVSYSTTLATVGVTRIIDLVSVACMLGLPWWVPSVLDGPISTDAHGVAVAALQTISLLALVAGAGGVVVVVLLKARASFVEDVAGRIVSRVWPAGESRVRSAVANFALGLSSGGSWAGLIEVALLTALGWVSLQFGFWRTFAAFGFDVDFLQVLVFLAVIALGVAVPTPAGLGTYHAGVILIVGQLWGFAAEDAGAVDACAIVSHLVAFGPVIALGVLELLRRPIPWSKVDRVP